MCFIAYFLTKGKSDILSEAQGGVNEKSIRKLSSNKEIMQPDISDIIIV
jgi:hypothetical protein